MDSTQEPETTTKKRAAAPVDTSRGAALRDRLRETIARLGLSQRAVAKESGVPHPVLGRWLRGEARAGEVADVETRVAAWFGGSRDQDDGFVLTATAKRVLGALAYCRRTGDMACIYGGPGVGKTRAIAHFRAADPEDTWVATMTPAAAGLVSALEVVADAVGISDCSGGARRISGAIRGQVTGRKGVIVIDESQHLSMAAIEELRSIHDASGVGLALVGNETSYARLTGGSRAAHYAQIYSRLGMRLFLHRPEAADVRELAKAMGVTDKDAIAFLERLAARPGALRGVTKAIRLAGAMRDGEAVTVQSLRDACRQLGAEV